MKYAGILLRRNSPPTTGSPTPAIPRRFLRLDELLDGGYVHEVWFFGSGNEQAEPHVGVARGGGGEAGVRRHVPQGRRAQWVQAGNGGDASSRGPAAACGIGCVNASRGPAASSRASATAIEGTANSAGDPVLHAYFKEFAGFDLDKRYKRAVRQPVRGGLRRPADPVPRPERRWCVTHSGKEYHDQGLRRRRRQRPLPAERPRALRPGQRPAGAVHHRGLADRQRARRQGPVEAMDERGIPASTATCPRLHGAVAGLLAAELARAGNRQKDDAGRPMKNWSRSCSTDQDRSAVEYPSAIRSINRHLPNPGRFASRHRDGVRFASPVKSFSGKRHDRGGSEIEMVLRCFRLAPTLSDLRLSGLRDSDREAGEGGHPQRRFPAPFRGRPPAVHRAHGGRGGDPFPRPACSGRRRMPKAPALDRPGPTPEEPSR